MLMAMEKDMKNELWRLFDKKPLVIAGPCSAETEEQLVETTRSIVAEGIHWIRAGIWKPRTRPNQFEGVGEPALAWIKTLKEELPVKFAVEVANPRHVELALSYGVDMLWIGARTTVNPFSVQEIADALRGVQVPVLVKNPINPDLSLWLGALERVMGAGVTAVGAIHRGFSPFGKSHYRNEPVWQIPIELKTHLPELPLICDPSHIGGDRSMIFDIAQQALDLSYDGLMIETHRQPDAAWSDARQQVTPQRLGEMLREFQVRKATSADAVYLNHLEDLRQRIDRLDKNLLEALALRMRTVKEIGDYKRENNVAVFQLERWNEIWKTRPDWGDQLHLDRKFVEDFYKLVHAESIRMQTEIMNRQTDPSS
jgi:chorismate mutase